MNSHEQMRDMLREQYDDAAMRIVSLLELIDAFRSELTQARADMEHARQAFNVYSGDDFIIARPANDGAVRKYVEALPDYLPVDSTTLEQARDLLARAVEMEAESLAERLASSDTTEFAELQTLDGETVAKIEVS